MVKCEQCYRYDPTGQKECVVCDFQKIYIERDKIDNALKEMDNLAKQKVAISSLDQAAAVKLCINILKRNIGDE